MRQLFAFARWLAQRRLLALGVCLAALTLALLRYAIATREEGAPLSREERSAPEDRLASSRAVFNPAIGDLVLLSRELGFAVEAAADSGWDEKETAKRIENQLLSLRQLYRREAEKRPELMGHLVLRLSVDSSGEVAQVEELRARLPDAGFRRMVVEEARGWRFDAGHRGPARILCPLLFIREGMDIRTVLSWEKALGAAASVEARREESVARSQKRGDGARRAVFDRGARAQERGPELIYRVRSVASLRNAPRFSAPTIQNLAAGAEVVVSSRVGDWLRVRTAAGETGYIRREFAVPVEGAATPKASAEKPGSRRAAE